MERADLVSRLLERLCKRGLACRHGGVKLFLRHAEVVDANAVEFLGQLAQALVSTLTHVLDDARRDFHGFGVKRALALQVRVVEHLARLQYDSTHVVPFKCAAFSALLL